MDLSPSQRTTHRSQPERWAEPAQSSSSVEQLSRELSRAAQSSKECRLTPAAVGLNTGRMLQRRVLSPGAEGAA